MIEKVCSLRQHDLDQVIRVERGSLLSVPHRRTPRSIVDHKYTRISGDVNSKKATLPGGLIAIVRGDATPLSSADRVG